MVLDRQYREDYFQQQRDSGNEYNQQYYKEDNNNKENDKTEKTNYYEDLFENCGSQEELKKRYRGLMKIYHPDIENGSSEKAMKITEAYEKIMREL